MARIVVVGAGVVALGAAMLLAGDGHRVIVLERDADGPPADPVDAWEQWQRPGLNQFRMAHTFLPRFRAILDAELPAAASTLKDAGALRMNYVRDVLPAKMSGGWLDGDERYALLTGRRVLVEAVLAAAAESAPGVQIRRGTAVAGLVGGTPALAGVPHVTGVMTKAGEVITADLVVDMSGRRSALPHWLEDIGARRPDEELEDVGFVYYGRHFRSADGSLPPMIGPAQIHWGTISSITLPADNGTWGVVLVTASTDTALRPLREAGRWEAVMRGLPLVAHWVDGTPIDDGVAVMARLEDRYRGFVLDGKPVATGVVAVADSWACSNPANGRGASIGLLHALTLRDQLRAVDAADPAAFAAAFHAATAETVEPWYRATLASDRHRVGEIEAGIRGGRYDSRDPGYQLEKALDAAFGRDPECTRANFDIRFVLDTPAKVFARPGLRDKTLRLGGGWRDAPPFGPTREQLLALVSP
ncbi:FAD-dependent oxidoreductase [Trebonia kvetii]|uniref:FAD-dependent oxidoreductase n=1 Tax=Trebonia kvetii TaxID=2480626 RepID=A0A6P2BVB2_9ACTN|nr:FAD-dependent oxidoreductase [Trebonia kvetii]TVZ02858.1 FAD-dependent oxidoreductase [Trebonia kvetii]